MILIGAEVKCGSFTDRQTGKDVLKKAFKGFYKDDKSGEWLKGLAGTDFEIIENRYGGIERVLLN